MNSRQRYKLRKREEAVSKLQSLKAQGAACGNCEHFERTPHPAIGKLWCSLGTDFAGILVTSTERICGDWSDKGTKP